MISSSLSSPPILRARAAPRVSSHRIACALLAALAWGCAEDADFSDEESVEQAALALVSLSCPAENPSQDFYTWSSASLPQQNGVAFKCESFDAGAYNGYRVLYRTSTLVHSAGSASEVALPASGIVLVPKAAAQGERPVIANTHGATGVIESCGPSRSKQYDSGKIAQVATKLPGAVIVVPDYTGLGVDHGARVEEVARLVTWPDGKKSAPFSNISHPFVSIEGEGRATIDLVRAAQYLPSSGVSSSPRWFSVGQSQGGHAAIAAAEVRARGYGAETRLLGVVAGAPASELDQNAWWAPEFKNAVFAMMTSSVPLEWRDLRASSYLSELGMMLVSDVSNRLCFVQSTLAETLLKYNVTGSLFKKNPWSDPAALAALAANSPGRAAWGVPVFVGQVRGDPLIDHRRTGTFVQKARLLNPALTFCEYRGEDVNLPVWLRIGNHDAFDKMFSTIPTSNVSSSPLIGCTGANGSLRTDPLTFVQTLYAASL